MKRIRLLPKFAPRLAVLVRLVTLISLTIGASGFTQFQTNARASQPAGTPLAETPSRPASGIGYVDFPYSPLDPINDPVTNDPSGETSESKLWWNDGFWWGLLYNHTTKTLNIYRLNWGAQSWEDTGVVVDTRVNVRADVLWDDTTLKLYVVSHVYTENSGGGAGANGGQFIRYSYDASIQEYRLDGSDFPKTVNNDWTETLVLAKETGSNARLWVTYVSRPTSSLFDVDYQVYVNSSADDGSNWGTPIALATLFPDAYVEKDDIASIVAFSDYIGVMWSQQRNTDRRYRFAVHANVAEVGDWAMDNPAQQYPVEFPSTSDDQINLKVTPNGQVLAAVKTLNMLANEPLVVLLGRETDGNWVSRTYSLKQDLDTQPIVQVDLNHNMIYMFVSGDNAGGQICYKTLVLQPDLSDLDEFNSDPRIYPRNCGTPIIEDAIYSHFSKPTSTKGFVTTESGIVVLANDNFTPAISDDADRQVYGHGIWGNPAPVITGRNPYINATRVSVMAPIVVNFSEDMNPDTLVTAFILRKGSNIVDMALTYDSETYTATFTPKQPLKVNTTYIAAMSTDAKDREGHSLRRQTANTWSFTTEPPTVQFSMPNYSEKEDAGKIDITIDLSVVSWYSVLVNYVTSDGIGKSGVDYSTVSGTLIFQPGQTSQTFSVPILNNPLTTRDTTVNLTLSLPDNTNAALGSPSSAVLTIRNTTQSVYIPMLVDGKQH